MLDKIKDRISLLLVFVFVTFLFTLATHLQVMDLQKAVRAPNCESAVGFGHVNAVIYDRFKMEVRIECSGPEEGTE